MTEKRFVGNFQGKMLVSIRDKKNNCNVNILQIVEIANKLVNENEQLKRQNRRRKRKLKAHRTVITELGEVILGYKGLIKTLKEDKKLLEQENNQLKKQLDGIRKSYSDFYGMNIRNAPWYGFKGDDLND